MTKSPLSTRRGLPPARSPAVAAALPAALELALIPPPPSPHDDAHRLHVAASDQRAGVKLPLLGEYTSAGVDIESDERAAGRRCQWHR